jgi:phosphatidylglycerophosphate synthase
VEAPVDLIDQPYSADGLIDRSVHRPCARCLVRLLIRLPVTPNAVTLAGGVLGVIAASQFWYATPHSAMLGLLLFFLQAVVDHTDGELARLTGQVSEIGRRLDVCVDTMTDVLIVVGMAVTATPGEGSWTLVLASLAGGGVLLCSLFTNFLPPPADRPVTRVTLQLANRDPVYFMLFTFLLLLWAADRFLSLFVWIVAIGTNVYWLIHVIQKTMAGRSQPPHR